MMARRRRRKSNTIGSFTYTYGYPARASDIARECRMYGYRGPNAYVRMLADRVLAGQAPPEPEEPEPPHPRQGELDAARERVNELRSEAVFLLDRFRSYTGAGKVIGEWNTLEDMVHSSLEHMVFADEVEREIEALDIIRVFYEKVVAFAREKLRAA
jgi:hypothetical protein